MDSHKTGQSVHHAVGRFTTRRRDLGETMPSHGCPAVALAPLLRQQPDLVNLIVIDAPPVVVGQRVRVR